MIDDSDETFAERMRKLREAEAERRDAEERLQTLTTARVEEAWNRTYWNIVKTFGQPHQERRDGPNFWMQWGTVVLNLGVSFSAIWRPTRRLAAMEIIRRSNELIQAPQTNISYVIMSPSDEYHDMLRLERWTAQPSPLPRTRVFNVHGLEDCVFFTIRSNGPTDWFGDSTEKRPAFIIEIP